MPMPYVYLSIEARVRILTIYLGYQVLRLMEWPVALTQFHLLLVGPRPRGKGIGYASTSWAARMPGVWQMKLGHAWIFWGIGACNCDEKLYDI